jgi:hypothetical protein
MLMLYNSDNYAVVQFDMTGRAEPAEGAALSHGGYEIVDKFARKEIFIQGAMAESFKQGVQDLIERGPTEDEVDEYLGQFTSLMQQRLTMH